MHGLCPRQASHEDLMKICTTSGHGRPGQLKTRPMLICTDFTTKMLLLLNMPQVFC